MSDNNKEPSIFQECYGHLLQEQPSGGEGVGGDGSDGGKKEIHYHYHNHHENSKKRGGKIPLMIFGVAIGGFILMIFLLPGLVENLLTGTVFHVASLLGVDIADPLGLKAVSSMMDSGFVDANTLINGDNSDLSNFLKDSSVQETTTTTTTTQNDSTISTKPQILNFDSIPIKDSASSGVIHAANPTPLNQSNNLGPAITKANPNS